MAPTEWRAGVAASGQSSRPLGVCLQGPWSYSGVLVLRGLGVEGLGVKGLGV